MSDQQMTPHERAKKLVDSWKRGDACGEPGLVTLVTTALQAQSNEDEARHRDQQGALRDLLRGEREYKNTLLESIATERDALVAHNAVLREALEPFARWAHQLDAPPNWVPDGCPIIASPGDISDFSVGQIRAARSALAATPAEAMESIRRQAKVEALENLPCDCKTDPRTDYTIQCPRCKALAELKGWK